MPPKTPYQSPLLTLLRGGKEALAPKPVQFGVPTAPTLPTALPQTANTTRQTVAPAPIQIPQAQPPVATPPPLNPLDIIRLGKEQTISQGVQEKQKSTFLNPVRDALFGNPKEKAILRDMQRRGIDPGFMSAWGTEGFWSFAGRDKEEQKERLFYTLTEKGIDPNRATEISYNAIESRDRNFFKLAEDLQSGNKSKRDQAADRLDELNLTTDEKVALGLQRAGQIAGTALEATDVLTFGTTKPVKKAAVSLIDQAKDSILKRFEFDKGTPVGALPDKVRDEYVTFLKETKNPTQEDINRGLELLRLDGRQVDDIAKEIAPATEFPQPRPGAMDIKRVETPKVEAPETPAEAKGSGMSFDEWVVTRNDEGVKNIPNDIKAYAKKIDDSGVYQARSGDELIKRVNSTTKEMLQEFGDEIGLDLPKSLSKKEMLQELANENYNFARLLDFDKSYFNNARQLKAEWDAATPPPVNKKLQAFREGRPSPQGGYIRNPLAETPVSKGVDNQAVSLPKSIPQYQDVISGKPPRPGVVNKSNPQAFEQAADGMFKQSWTKLRETVQDSWIRAKNLQRQKGVVVKPDANPYLAETLFHGRVHTRLEEVKGVITKIDKDIVTTSKKLNVPNEQMTKTVNKYLQAQHAAERNLKLGDGAAGMTTKEANEYLAEIASSKYGKEIKRVADELLEINKKVLTTLRDSQVISDDVYETLTKTYKNHVPLNRVMDTTEDIGQALTGAGFSVRGTGIKRAVGSQREVSDIITNITTNVEQAIIRAEKNLVDLNTLRFARNNKDLGLFEEIKAKPMGLDFGGKPIMQQINDPMVLTMRENGKPVYLKINDPHLAAMYQNVNMEHVPNMMQWIATFTRLYSSLHTRFNYEFAFSNKFRDVQEMVVDMASRKEMGFKQAGKALTREPASIKAVTDAIRGADTEGARLYKQMQMDGGTTGGLSLSTRKQVEVDIEQIRKLNRSNPRKAARMLLEAVDNWNTIFEDSTRLSVYKEALSNGTDRQTAAMLAKESTVNFNKKGTGGSIINSLYMFSNASIQGTTKMLRAMKNPKVAGAVVSTMGLAVYNMNKYNDSVDPDWRDKVTEYDRSSNFVVMLPTEGGEAKYVTIPVSWGLKPIKVSMEHVTDYMSGYNTNIIDMARGVMVSAATSYNPLAGSESVVETLTPTFLKTPQEIRSNVAWHGGKIRPDYDPNRPESEQYFGSLERSATGRTAIKATGAIAEVTNGEVQISPANVNYAFEAYVGGLGRSVTKILNTITSIGKGESLEPKEIPVLSRFLKVRDVEQTEAQQAYKELNKQREEQSARTLQADKLFKELKQLTPEEANAKLVEIAREDKKMAEMIKERVKKDNWTPAEKAIQSLGVENGKRAEYVYNKAKQMTPEEANAYLVELFKKGVISKNVVEQIKELKAKDNGIID